MSTHRITVTFDTDERSYAEALAQAIAHIAPFMVDNVVIETELDEEAFA